MTVKKVSPAIIAAAYVSDFSGATVPTAEVLAYASDLVGRPVDVEALNIQTLAEISTAATPAYLAAFSDHMDPARLERAAAQAAEQAQADPEDVA